MLEIGKEICSCKRKKCARYKDCKACIEYHNNNNRHPLPYCKRKYDSS